VSTYAALFGAISGIFGFLLGLVSLALHWVRRAEHPDTAHLSRQIQQLELGLADITDEEPAGEQTAAPAHSPKDVLRSIARTKGVLR
jgi:hypothetical protein